LYKPKWYWDYHGWGANRHTIDYSKQPKAVLVQLYARLAVENPALPDDRASAKYVIHVSSDRKTIEGSAAGGDIGISRWKRVTSEWQPHSFLTGGWTKEQFMATNPPISITP
jgi:hypothetical protein